MVAATAPTSAGYSHRPTYIVMAYIVMANERCVYIVMAYIVMVDERCVLPQADLPDPNVAARVAMWLTCWMAACTAQRDG